MILNIKKENDSNSITKEGSVNFKIKLKLGPNHVQDWQQAILKLYKKDNTGEETKVSDNDLVDNADIIIKTKLSCGEETKTFNFNVKLVKIIHQLDLNTITTSLQEEFNLNYCPINCANTYSNLNWQIINLNLFKNKPLKDCQIKYYDKEINGTEISKEQQTIGKFWIQIIADAKDPNWKGNSNRIAVMFVKTNLNDIKTLTTDANTSLKFEANLEKFYKDIKDQIFNTIEFENKPVSLIQDEGETVKSMKKINKNQVQFMLK